MKRILLVGLILLAISCDKDHSPTKPGLSDIGTIKIVIGDKTDAKKDLPDSLSSSQKPAKSETINQLEVRILNSSNTPIASKTLLPVLGFFEGTIKVKAQDNLKVLCIGKLDGVIKRIGVDEDVDVKAGVTTSATIPSSQWNVSATPVITDITPNPSKSGDYTVVWSAVPTGTEYTLQEANIQDFSDSRSVYTGAETQKVFSGKSEGTYYYRIMASNEYNVSSTWSDSNVCRQNILDTLS